MASIFISLKRRRRRQCACCSLPPTCSVHLHPISSNTPLSAPCYQCNLGCHLSHLFYQVLIQFWSIQVNWTHLLHQILKVLTLLRLSQWLLNLFKLSVKLSVELEAMDLFINWLTVQHLIWLPVQNLDSTNTDLCLAGLLVLNNFIRILNMRI